MVKPIRRVGVVLFQLGGPDTLEAVEPFLFNLFCDPDIIDFPFARIGRKPLAKLISTTRAKKVQHHYSTIGGGSPIRRFTEQQARALQLKLNSSGLDARCFVAMRYWHPFTSEAIEQLRRAECDQVVLLPLYPQYSSTTTGSRWNNHYHICYQSKVGASKWLQPSLRSTLRDLTAQNVKEACVVPISFVSDHVETLGEIDHHAREQAAALGIERFEMMAGLNDSPTFIAALADLVMNAIRAEVSETERLVAAD